MGDGPRCAWIAWDARHPEDSGAVPVFTRGEREVAALDAAARQLGYDLDDLDERGLVPADVVYVQRAPHLDDYDATAFLAARQRLSEALAALRAAQDRAPAGCSDSHRRGGAMGSIAEERGTMSNVILTRAQADALWRLCRAARLIVPEPPPRMPGMAHGSAYEDEAVRRWRDTFRASRDNVELLAIRLAESGDALAALEAPDAAR